MIGSTHVTVVMPAFNESRFIESALLSQPSFVDRILVIDDASSDGTGSVVRELGDPRVRLLTHDKNFGVGRSIATGYEQFLLEGATDSDLCVVMAGDSQMDPADLPALLAPILSGAAEYVKGDRLYSSTTRAAMPWSRFLGNQLLTQATRLATGYWVLRDSQCGYTAMSGRAMRLLNLAAIYPRYGYPNDLLLKLQRMRIPVAQVPVRAVYQGEISGIQPTKVIPRILRILVMGFLTRVFRSSSGSEPLLPRLSYGMSVLSFAIAACLGVLKCLPISMSNGLVFGWPLLSVMFWLSASLVSLLVGVLLERKQQNSFGRTFVLCDSLP
jgi:glycosyltransferase involved in cell wall biosynthesis